jgi:hypothetical protein
MVLTVSFVLSPVTGLFCHRRQRTNVLSAPGRADKTSANLTPASGRQDHTTSPYAAIVSRPRALDRSRIQRTRPAITSHAKRCRVHRIPPRVRDDRDTPLCGEDEVSSRDDLGWVKTEISFGKSEIRLDTPADKPPDGQITIRQRESRSCPGRGAALFALLRRAGTYVDTRTLDPGSAAHHAASAARCAASGERVARVERVDKLSPEKPITAAKCNRWVSRSLSSGAHSRDPLAPPILVLARSFIVESFREEWPSPGGHPNWAAVRSDRYPSKP